MIYLKDAYETKFSKYMFSFSTSYQYHRYVIAVIPYIACCGLCATWVEKIEVENFLKFSKIIR